MDHTDSPQHGYHYTAAGQILTGSAYCIRSCSLFTQSIRLAPIAACFGLSLPAYLCALFYYPVIKRQIRARTGETEDSGEPDNSEEIIE